MKNQNKILINGKEFDFRLNRRRGVRNLRITIYRNGQLVVSAPKYYPIYLVRRFLSEKKNWLEKNLKIFPKQYDLKSDYQTKKIRAREIITQKLVHYNNFYNFSYNKIFIKKQNTIWGSCSAAKNLNFNYKLIDLPEKLMDYVIVHELCHLQELNHSRRFRDLVCKTFPDYKKYEQALKQVAF